MTRRVLAALVILSVAGAAAAQRKPNVLFLISDDLTATALSCYGNAQCKTPAIDRLAARGVRFDAAYCQYPVCGPSRAALMSGMYPQAIGVMGNGDAKKFTAALGERPTMSQLFLQGGWHAVRVGKIFHMRVPGDITAGVHGPDHAASWSERFSLRAPEWRTEGEAEHLTREKLRRDPDRHYGLGFGTAFYVVRGNGNGAEQADVQAANKAIELLNGFALGPREKPLFLAVGFVRPHVPLVAPASFYEPYPADEMKLPAQVEDDWSDIPELGRSRNSVKTGLTTAAVKRRVLEAYYASVAFMDAQVGRILDALGKLGLREDTIVVFTSDHGYHLGEHEFWQKMSLHEESTRIPLIVSAPGVAPAITTSLAEQIDIYPTLAELAGLEVPEHVQGKSLVPVLEEPTSDVHEHVYCTKKSGHLIRTKDWAYLSWRDATAELYDMRTDPRQFTNVVDDKANGVVVADMRRRLDSALLIATGK